jgi:phosphoribosyl 1,2-cyclic phosphodiesterase
MGTGIIDLGKTKPFLKEYHIIISSFFWDYIQGMPFFYHIHRKGVKINLYSSANKTLTSMNLDTLFDGTYSPLENINNLSAVMEYHQIPYNKQSKILGANVTSFQIKKKNLVSAIKIEYQGKTLVYAGNFEIDPNHERLNRMIEFINNADLFICDAHYTESQYIDKKKWGHSKIDNAVDLAVKGNVKRLHLFHHHPFNADNFLKSYLNNIKRERNDLSNILIDFAKEGNENIFII